MLVTSPLHAGHSVSILHPAAITHITLDLSVFQESLGHVNINLVDVVNNGRINEKYHLINSRNGTIHVEIKWSTV